MRYNIYDEYTKEYKYSMPLQIDPLESQLKGFEVYLIMPYSTFIEPIIEEGKVAVFDEKEQKWNLIEDNRGKLVYDKKTGEAFIINELGSIPKNYTLEKPFILQEEKIIKIKEAIKEYEEEQDKRISIGKITENINAKKDLDDLLVFIKDENFGTFETSDNESIILSKEEIEKYSHFFYVRSILLALKKEEIISQIKLCKNKTQLQKISFNFNIDKEIKEVELLNKEDFKVYIENKIKG